jgi:salicylate hydroxylase
MQAGQQVVIVGGGIAGLAAAVGVANAGHRAIVLERSAGFSELGAGIQLAPNAFHALDYLGIKQSCTEHAVAIDELQLGDATSGQLLGSLKLKGAFRARFGNPYLVVHRRDLHGALLQACQAHPGIELRAASPVSSYRETDGRIEAWNETSCLARGDSLLGADGVRSAIRAQLLGDGQPRLCGHVAYRALLAAEAAPPPARRNVAILWAAPGAHVVYYPIGRGDEINLVATLDVGEQAAFAGVPAERDEVLRAFGAIRGEPRAMLESASAYRKWSLSDRPPVENWVSGRVALIGDAAHPMLQYAAQGACMALEDAACLSFSLRAASSLELALRRYNERRALRTARVQRVATALGERIYHVAGAAAQARNRELAALEEPALLDKLAWLYARPENEAWS